MGRLISSKFKPVNYVGPKRNYASVQLATTATASSIRVSMARAGASDGEIEKAIKDRRKSSRMVNRKVHRLVLEAFVGPCPDGMVGCHNDGDTRNNRLSNRRWDTPGSNNRDKQVHGTDHQVKKTHCPQGHEYTPENCYDPTMKHRRCKTCAQEKARAQHKRGYLRPSRRHDGHVTPWSQR
ncbi:MAG: HNH endonuclease signature motif containing protein, partial [Lysobacterales bacterium]